jgi:hypothetical protein
MPKIFKGLATVNAWALFVIAWVSLIAGYLQLLGIYTSVDIMKIPSGAPSVWMPIVGGFTCLVLSAVVMKLRKALD